MTASASVAPTGAELLWPFSRRDELAHALARAAGVARPAAPRWFNLRYEDVAPERPPSSRVRGLAPAFFALDADEAGVGGGLLAVLAWEAGGARVLAPDGGQVTLSVARLARLLTGAAEARVSRGIDGVVARAAVDPARASGVRAALVGAALAGEAVVDGWRVRSAAGSLAAALRAAGLARRLTLAASAYAAELVLLVTAWWMVGTRATSGRGPAGNVLEWVGVLAAFVAARFAASWAAGRLALEAGRLLRERLVDGLLALDTEPLRAEGIGQLLGRVLETEAVESLALGGGLLAVAGVFELTTGAVVLVLGARGAVEVAFLSIVLAGGVVLGTGFWRALTRWSALRLGLTHDLVERLVGHRTLVAQQPPELRHVGEEEALARYERAGRALDRSATALAVVLPRGGLLVGVATLAPALAAAHDAARPIAATLGGVLFVYGALRKLTQAFPALATAAVAWRQVAPLFAGAGAPAPVGPRAAASVASPTIPADEPGAAPLIAARDIGFRYPDRARPALAGCSFEIHRGDRILLEGASGGGKSTLAALVAGLRAPDVGLLNLDGVAQSVMGLPSWRERVGVVPQFHENHVFSTSVLFNLLMGRAWPPRREDVREAEALCRELGLGGLLARMPSGIEQIVGESGWQLSHGERSRLFIARALLQRLDVRVLDESFAALDPETLERVLDCVLARAETLLVIAHP